MSQGSFSPQAGQPGAIAFPADSAAFRDWAISCDVQRGLKNIAFPDSGVVDAGSPVYAVGKADNPLTVSLGDGGTATLQFSAGIYDGEGYDFAVFENGFGNGADAFLELAFVEVSSNGQQYMRFPAISELSSTSQTQPYGNSDATFFHNLAGKHIANFGTPFDLADLPDTTWLDKSNITHVRIIDVVGSVDSTYASFDSKGNMVNDPWPTSFGSGGFDLDAVGVIHSLLPLGIPEMIQVDSKAANESFDVLGRPLDPSSQGQLLISSDGTKRLRQ